MTGQEIKEILRKNGINQSELADMLGISAQTFNSRLNARYFKEAYMHEINGVLGKNIFPVGEENAPLAEMQPIYDSLACAGKGISIEESGNIIGWVNIPQFKGCIGLNVIGDSMRGKYNSGDIIFVRPVLDKQMIDYGRYYVVSTEEERYIKGVYSSRKENTLRLVAYNQETLASGDRLYPDIEIHLRDIKYIYKVVGKLERETI